MTKVTFFKTELTFVYKSQKQLLSCFYQQVEIMTITDIN